MSLKAIPTHLLYEITSLMDDHDLLALASTSRTFSRLILQYFRVSHLSSLLGENPIWLQLEEHPQLHNFVTELCIGDHPALLPVSKHISITQEDTETEAADKGRGILLSVPRLVQVLPYLKNLKSAKFIFKSLAKMTVKEILDAFSLSSPILEEFEANIYWTRRDVDLPLAGLLGRRSYTMFTPAPNITQLSIWHTFDTRRLTKCAIHLEFNHELSAAGKFMWESRQRGLISWTEYDFISELLFHSPELTHLYIYISPMVQTKILHYSWPKLEHMTIRNVVINASLSSPDPDELRQFLERHPNLLTLSLPSTSYPASSDHYITEGILPRLRSFYYDNTTDMRERTFPTLCQLLSPSAARNLTHLTLRMVDATLTSQGGIYRQLKRLESCYLSGDQFQCDEIGVQGLMKVLEHFIAHATNIRYLQLPGLHLQVASLLPDIISLIQLLPNLTHLFGLFTPYHIRDMHRLGFLTQIFRIPRIKYINISKDTLCLTRNISARRMDYCFVQPDELEAGTDQRCLHPQNWGEFYYGTVCRQDFCYFVD